MCLRQQTREKFSLVYKNKSRRKGEKEREREKTKAYSFTAQTTKLEFKWNTSKHKQKLKFKLIEKAKFKKERNPPVITTRLKRLKKITNSNITIPPTIKRTKTLKKDVNKKKGK